MAGRGRRVDRGRRGAGEVEMRGRRSVTGHAGVTRAHDVERTGEHRNLLREPLEIVVLLRPAETGFQNATRLAGGNERLQRQGKGRKLGPPPRQRLQVGIPRGAHRESKSTKSARLATLVWWRASQTRSVLRV